MHIDSEQQHQDDVGEQVDVVDVLEEHVPPHAEKTGHQLMSKKLLTFVMDLKQRKHSKSSALAASFACPHHQVQWMSAVCVALWPPLIG